MEDVAVVGVDLAKSVFQVHGVDAGGVGAMAVIRYAERHGTRRPWLAKLLTRRHPRIAAIALANKIGRIAWALMTSGERYREPVMP